MAYRYDSIRQEWTNDGETLYDDAPIGYAPEIGAIGSEPDLAPDQAADPYSSIPALDGYAPIGYMGGTVGEPTYQPTPVIPPSAIPEPPQEPSGLLRRGYETTKTGLQATLGIGGEEGLAESIAEDIAMEQAVPVSEEERAWMEGIQQQSEEFEAAEGFWPSAGEALDVAGAVVSDPYQLGREAVRNIPNMAPTLAGGAAGAGIGSFFGPLGTVVGGLVGAAAGTFGVGFGQKYVEEAQEEAQARGLNPGNEADMLSVLADQNFQEQATGKSAKYGATLGIMDAASMLLTGGIASAPGRALRGAITGAAAKHGVQLGTKQGLAQAARNTAFLREIRPAVNAYREANRLRPKSLRVTGAWLAEAAGEGAGEAAAQLVADGKIDIADVVLETAIGGMTGVAEAAFGAALGRRTAESGLPLGMVEDAERLLTAAQAADTRAARERAARALERRSMWPAPSCPTRTSLGAKRCATCRTWRPRLLVEPQEPASVLSLARWARLSAV